MFLKVTDLDSCYHIINTDHISDISIPSKKQMKEDCAECSITIGDGAINISEQEARNLSELLANHLNH